MVTSVCVVQSSTEVISCFFFFKQKTAYEMRISDWSSDVCSSDLRDRRAQAEPRKPVPGAVSEQRRNQPDGAGEHQQDGRPEHPARMGGPCRRKIGRASCRERVCQYV